jgi:hypothetical protein
MLVRYTFWIKPFEDIDQTENNKFVLKNNKQLQLLHHDLMERLSSRIGTLSLLKLPSGNDDAPRSHIHISHHYVILQDQDNKWIIHVMPPIRIGPPTKPESPAEPIKYPI